MFVVGWYSNITDASGKGITPMSYEVCKQVCRDANQEFPELEHFPVNNKTGDIPDWK